MTEPCPASAEAVWEQEDATGDIGCPLCGRDADQHPSEHDDCSECGIVGGDAECPRCSDLMKVYPRVS